MKLKDIVDNALADANVKLASAVDVQVSPTYGEIDLGIKLAAHGGKKCAECGKEDCTCSKAEAKEEAEEKNSALDEAKYAMKLAEALDAALPYIQVKMAEGHGVSGAGTSHVNAPGGLQVFEGGHGAEQTKHPTIKPATVSLQQASSGGGGDEDRNDGNKTGIETNRADYSDPDWTKNKESALNRLSTKIAQAEDLRAMGHIQRAGMFAKQAQAEFESRFGKLANAHGGAVQGAPAHETTGTEVIARSAGSVPNAGQKSDLESGSDAERRAEAVRSERKEGGAPGAKTAGINFASMPIKLAQDPSSPQPQGLDSAKGSDFLLSTEPGESKQFPGNEDVAGMTKRDAKTQSTRTETAPFIREGAFSAKADPGIAANLSLFRGGEKISSLQAGAGRALLRKIAAAENDPNASDADKTKAASLRRAIAKQKEANVGSLPGLV